MRTEPAPRVIGTKNDCLERLGFFEVQLEEFLFGYEKLRIEPDHYGNEAPTSKCFYYNSLIQYAANLYLSGGGAHILGWLRDINLPEYADRIEVLLAREIGPSTLRSRLKAVRNQLLVHCQYSDRILRQLKREHDADNNRPAMRKAIDELFHLTAEIANEVHEISTVLLRGSGNTPS